MSVTAAEELRKSDPAEYEKRSMASMARHVQAMIDMQKRGAEVFDYGNNLRQRAFDFGVKNAFDFPGFVPAYIRPLFCDGKGPFRWVALSGEAEDIYKTDQAVMELFPEDEHLNRWLKLARDKVPFQGLPSRICWLGYGERVKAGLKFNKMVADGTLKATIKTDAFFSFHHVNAFDNGDELVVDMATYKDAEIVQNYYMSRLSRTDQQLPFGRMERFVLNLKDKKLKERKIISEACIELPNFDYQHYHGRSDYRFVYGCGIHPNRTNEFYNQIVKIDMKTGNHTAWHQADYYPGEAVFLPHPNRKEEDDGVLLSVVLDADQGHSFLLILDAKTLQEHARAELPHAVLFGYHGSFFGKKATTINK
jgi:hypothetical protein